MGISAPRVKAALVEALTTLLETPNGDLVVTYGLPGQRQPAEIVAVLDQRTEIDRPTHGPSRSREDTVATEVRVSVYRPGDETVQKLVTDRAWEIVDAIAQHFRARPAETLGGVCRDAWVSGADSTEGLVRDVDVVEGRLCEIAVTVTTQARY